MLKDIIGMATSRINRYKADSALTTKLVRDIGPEGIIGAKNMSTYTSRIGKMVRQGDQPGAVKYSRIESQKVKAQ